MKLEYCEKWSHPTAMYVTCIAFSTHGNLVAYGGEDVVTIVCAETGQPKAILQNNGTTVAALLWIRSDTLTFAFRNGTIVDLEFKNSKQVSTLVIYRLGLVTIILRRKYTQTA